MRNSFNVRNVGKPSVVSVQFKDMKDLTWREAINITSVGNPFIVLIYFEVVNKLTPERKPMNVEILALIPQFLINM